MNLASLRRFSGSGISARLQQIEWLAQLPIVHGGPLSARLTLKTTGLVDDITVGLGFSTMDGVRLLTYESDFPGVRPSASSGETLSTTVIVEHLPLPPGSYTVDLGIRSGDMHSVDYLPGVIRVDVTPSQITLPNQMQSGAGVRLPSFWNWQPDRVSTLANS